MIDADEVAELVKTVWTTATAVEPALGTPKSGDVARLRDEIGAAREGIASVAPEDREELEDALARVVARASVVAVAAGDNETAHAWLQAAQRGTRDPELARILELAMRSPERYRKLVHGRYLVAHGREAAGRRLWKQVASAGDDVLRAAARAEQQAPRPLNGKLPTLHRVNGIGAAFYGRRDRADDGSYVTTHCFSAVFIPVFPLGAYRVRDSGPNSYIIMAREQLSVFAKLVRLALPAAIVLTIAGYMISDYINDPARKARNSLAAAIEAAATGAPEAGLARLDAELKGPDLMHAPTELAQRAGAQVVHLTAGYVAKPFTRTAVDQVNRVVRRYQDLPVAARGGAALDALLVELDGWAGPLGAPDDQDAKLAILRLEASVADPRRAAAIAERMSVVRIAVAEAKAADWPLDALAVLTDDAKDSAALAKAGPIVQRIAASPALLDDAGPDLDVWLATLPTGDAERARIVDLREQARAVRAQAEAEAAGPVSLAALAKDHPGDQRVAVAFAHRELDAGKVDAAAARIHKLGPDGMLVRDARFVLAKVAIAQDKLDVADGVLSALLASRLQRFIAASAALEASIRKVQDQLESNLRSGIVSEDFRSRVDAAPESERQELIAKWANDQIENDPDVQQKREAYLAYADIVPTSIAAGTVKLRRAQAASGPARETLLAEAEKTFLAVKTQAEGQPEYQLGLGEIYARLGKTKESDAAFQSVLDKNVPELTYAVANVYRDIGGVTRATQIATALFGTAPQRLKSQTAVLLGMLATTSSDEGAEAESWFKKADQNDPFVRTALLEIEGRRLMRAGKSAECDRKFAQAAQTYLQIASAHNSSGYNNAAVAQQERFMCSGDLTALSDAVAAQDKAYRADGDSPIVVGNLASLLQNSAMVRVTAKRVDLRALRISSQDAQVLIERLLDSDEREAVLADLAADPSWRRAPELLGHAEVLAPSDTRPYSEELQRAQILRDPVAGAAVLDRIHHAKALDTSDNDSAWKRWQAGERDDTTKQQQTTDLAHYAEIIARHGIDPHTRAAALLLHATVEHQFASLWGDADHVASARAELAEAVKLWPALRDDSVVASWVIDEIALRLDAKKWQALRRDRSAIVVLARLVDSGDPFAAQIRGAAQWPDVLANQRGDTTKPELDDLRLARLLGDKDLEARAKAVLDDKLARQSLELHAIVEPADPSYHEDLVYFDKH